MEILKFEDAPAPRKAAPKKSNLKSLAGLATVAAVAVLGSTLAANISLGSGSTLEFGQGVQVTAACDSSITLTPKVTFVNGSGAAATFYLSTVSFGSVDARAINSSAYNTNESTGCATRTFTLNAYGDTSATIGINSSTPVVSTGFSVANTANLGSATSSFDLGFGSLPYSTSGAVYKLTLQSN